MAFKDYFSRQATDYAVYRPRYPAALFAWLAQQCAHRDLAWDCAAGNGQAAIALASHFQHVIATDGSADQLRQAEKHPKVTYREALAEQSGLADNTLDLITVAQAAHWFELDQFYSEAKRVLKPGGMLTIWCYGLFTLNSPAIDRLLENFYSNTLEPFWPPERRIVEAGYRTLPFPFEELSAPSFSMHVAWTLPQLLGYLSTWSGTQNFIAAHRHNPLEDLAAQLAVVWEGDRRHITWPIHLRSGYL